MFLLQAHQHLRITNYLKEMPMNFINPPPFGEVGDFTNNPTYTVGSTLNVTWTRGKSEKPTSLCLFQLNGTDYLYPFESLIRTLFINFVFLRNKLKQY